MKNRFVMIKSVALAMSMIVVAHAENKWTGFYAGVQAGHNDNNLILKSQHLGFTKSNDNYNTSADFLVFNTGAQVGYMRQFSEYLVSGVEATLSINGEQTDTFNLSSNINPDVFDQFTFRNQMQTSVRGRMGRIIDWNKNNYLPYVIAGVSAANLGLTYKNEGGDYYSTTTTQLGWLIGAGLEWKYLQHWSLRAEYSYINYGNAVNLRISKVYNLQDPNGNAHIDLCSSNIAVLLNYWL